MKNLPNACNKMTVNVKISLGEQFQVDIKKNATIRKLKQKVKKLRGLPINCQMFVCDGRQLQNTDSLSSLSNTNNLNELTLLLLINEEQKNKPNKEIPIPEKEALAQTFTLQPLPLDFDASSQAPILKISFEDQHRRVQFEDASYSKLIELCTHFFGVKNPHRMVICYQDEDSDMIQLSSDAELSYALTYHTAPTPNGLKLLKLFFSVKQKKKADSASVQFSHLDALTEETSLERSLRNGSIVILTSLQDQLHLSLSEDSDRVVGNAELSPNAHWLVEFVQTNKDQEDPNQLVLISNPAFTARNSKKSHLRVAASGKVDHKGANGNWARFALQHVGNGQIKLRSVGRSIQHADRCLLGITKQPSPNGCREAVGDLTEDAPEALFHVQFV
jgi:hypothetical protein